MRGERSNGKNMSRNAVILKVSQREWRPARTEQFAPRAFKSFNIS